MRKPAQATGVTLVELLVVLAVLGFLALIVFSSRPTLDPRMPCGTNLSYIGKAMLAYSNDYDDTLPCAGGVSSRWTGRVADWQAKDRNRAYGLGADGTGGEVSISASLYLLLRYTEITPKSFVCKGDRGAKEFRLEDYRFRDGESKLSSLWDFGPNPAKHCSYAYQMPYGSHKLTMFAEPGCAIVADRNPWMNARAAKGFLRFQPDMRPFDGTADDARLGNAVAHRRDGQNVLFLDTHVSFQKRSYCGLEDDNIYTLWHGADKVRGQPPRLGSQPAGERDSLLVNDPPAWRR